MDQCGKKRKHWRSALSTLVNCLKIKVDNGVFNVTIRKSGKESSTQDVVIVLQVNVELIVYPIENNLQ